MKQQNLSVYFTAGYPKLDDTAEIIRELSKEGLSYIEVGIPFSDPLADGPVIQASATQAIANGANLSLILDQLESLGGNHADLVLMGYYNVFLQYGMEKLLTKAKLIGVKAFIIPDCPPEEYENEWKGLFDQHGIGMIFLITPACRDERIRYLANLSQPFVYAVSDYSITGSTDGFSLEQIQYFEKLSNMALGKPIYLGFGISDNQTFATANAYFDGAIIGSAFIKKIGGDKKKSLKLLISEFVSEIITGS